MASSILPRARERKLANLRIEGMNPELTQMPSDSRMPPVCRHPCTMAPLWDGGFSVLHKYPTPEKRAYALSRSSLGDVQSETP